MNKDKLGAKTGIDLEKTLEEADRQQSIANELHLASSLSDPVIPINPTE